MSASSSGITIAAIIPELEPSADPVALSDTSSCPGTSVVVSKVVVTSVAVAEEASAVVVSVSASTGAAVVLDGVVVTVVVSAGAALRVVHGMLGSDCAGSSTSTGVSVVDVLSDVVTSAADEVGRVVAGVERSAGFREVVVAGADSAAGVAVAREVAVVAVEVVSVTACVVVVGAGRLVRVVSRVVVETVGCALVVVARVVGIVVDDTAVAVVEARKVVLAAVVVGAASFRSNAALFARASRRAAS